MSCPTTASSYALSAASRTAGSSPTIASRISTASEIFRRDVCLVSRGVLLIPSLPLQCPVDIGSGHLLFLGQPMRHDRDILALKEVENAVVHSPDTRPQLVDPITQQVCVRASQFMAACG